MDQRLSIITLGVRDVKASRAFYDSLGWVVATEEGADNIVFYNLNGFVFGLYPLEGLIEETGQVETPAGARFTLAYNVSDKKTVDKLLTQAKNCGAKTQDAVERFWGGYSGYFSDPDGHYWEVAFNPFSLPQEDGTYKA
jgi:predicted lactoylglutathione lyase